MKTTIFKKTLAVLAAVMLVASMLVPMMSVTASADDTATMNATGSISTNATVLNIPKGIVMRNVEDGNYCCCVIRYNFSIASATPPSGATVGAVQVKPGVAAAVSITSQPNFIQELVQMNSSGQETTKNITITVDPTKFTAPGVYRYVITDNTTSADLYKVGIVRNNNAAQTPVDYQTTRYLDIFINSNSVQGGSYGVAGYVLMKNNPASNDTNVIQKSAGFIQSDSLGYDLYRTYNVRLEKVIEGSLADPNHEFPFTVTINNNDGNGLTKRYFWAKNTISTWTPSTIVSDDPFANTDAQDLASVSLKGKDVVYIRGLVPMATVSYTETNDTNDTYKVRVTGQKDPNNSTNLDTLVEAADKAHGATTVLPAQLVSTYTTVNSTNDVSKVPDVTSARDVKFHNKIDAISPTGVVLRFGAFIIMAGFGVYFLILAAKSRRREATSVI